MGKVIACCALTSHMTGTVNKQTNKPTQIQVDNPFRLLSFLRPTLKNSHQYVIMLNIDIC